MGHGPRAPNFDQGTEARAQQGPNGGAGEAETVEWTADPAAGIELDGAQLPGMREDHMDTPRSQPQDPPKQRKRPAGRGGHFGLAMGLVALGLCGCATAPPPPTYVAGTLTPRCDSSTSECGRKSAPPPP